MFASGACPAQPRGPHPSAIPQYTVGLVCVCAPRAARFCSLCVSMPHQQLLLRCTRSCRVQTERAAYITQACTHHKRARTRMCRTLLARTTLARTVPPRGQIPELCSEQPALQGITSQTVLNRRTGYERRAMRRPRVGHGARATPRRFSKCLLAALSSPAERLAGAGSFAISIPCQEDRGAPGGRGGAERPPPMVDTMNCLKTFPAPPSLAPLSTHPSLLCWCVGFPPLPAPALRALSAPHTVHCVCGERAARELPAAAVAVPCVCNIGSPRFPRPSAGPPHLRCLPRRLHLRCSLPCFPGWHRQVVQHHQGAPRAADPAALRSCHRCCRVAPAGGPRDRCLAVSSCIVL